MRGAQSLVERRFPYRLNVGAGGNVANISEHISILAPSSPDLINTRLQGGVVRVRWQETVETVSMSPTPDDTPLKRGVNERGAEPWWRAGFHTGLR